MGSLKLRQDFHNAHRALWTRLRFVVYVIQLPSHSPTACGDFFDTYNLALDFLSIRTILKLKEVFPVCRRSGAMDVWLAVILPTCTRGGNREGKLGGVQAEVSQ